MIDVLDIQLEPHYQPIISLKNGRVFGYESLIRSKHHVLNSPQKLFKQATIQNKMVQFDLLCFEKGIKNAPIGSHIFLNVNASTLTSSLGQQFFSQTSFNRVVIEITECEKIRNRKHFEAALKWLMFKGCHFAIDDIASGYDRLLNLVEYEADYVKIDRALVKNCERRRRKRELLKLLVRISKIYSAKTIAEGIETKEEYQVTKELGFDYGQGFYFAKPLPVRKIQNPLVSKHPLF